MSIKVYWSFISDEWLRAKEPKLIFTNFVSNKLINDNENLKRAFLCPAVTDAFKNVYGLSSIYDYSFKIDSQKKEVHSDMYDQKFFDNHVVVRDLDSRLFSFYQKYIFFTEEKSLNMTCGIPPFYENNSIASDTHSIMGKYDIGKWFRPLDFAFFLNKEKDSFNISNDEIFSYIKFDTDEKIIFSKFMMTPKLNQYSMSCSEITYNRNLIKRGMPYFYNYFGRHFKNNILKEIKENLV